MPTPQAKMMNKSSGKRINDNDIVSDDEEWGDISMGNVATKWTMALISTYSGSYQG